jgi:hypothetical protein
MIRIKDSETRQSAVTKYVTKCIPDKQQAIDFLTRVYMHDPLAPDAPAYKKMIESYRKALMEQKAILNLTDKDLIEQAKNILSHLDYDKDFMGSERLVNALRLSKSTLVLNYLLNTLDTSTIAFKREVIISTFGLLKNENLPANVQTILKQTVNIIVVHLTKSLADTKSYYQKQVIIRTVDDLISRWEVEIPAYVKFNKAVYQEMKQLPIKYKPNQTGFCGNDPNLPMYFIPHMMRYLKQHDPGNYPKYVKEFHDTTAIYNILPGFFDRELNNKTGQDNPGQSYF